MFTFLLGYLWVTQGQCATRTRKKPEYCSGEIPFLDPRCEQHLCLSGQMCVPGKDPTVKEPVLGLASLALPDLMGCLDLRDHTSFPCCHCEEAGLLSWQAFLASIPVFHFSDDASETSPGGTGAVTSTLHWHLLMRSGWVLARFG